MNAPILGHILKRSILLIGFVLFFEGCGQKSEIDTPPAGIPNVILTNPADGTVNFSKDRLENPPNVWALFSSAMNSTSVRSNTFLRTGCNESVLLSQGSPSYDPKTRTVTISPAELEPDQQYLVRILRNATDLDGTSLSEEVVWRFATGPYIDNYAPRFDGVEKITVNSPTELTLSWSAAVDGVDQGTPQDMLKYLVYRGTSNSCTLDQFKFTSVFKTLNSADVCTGLDQDPSTLECSYQVTGLSANTQYCFVVRAQDRGCHIEANRKLVEATTNVGGKLYVVNAGLNNLVVFDNAAEAEKISPRQIQSNRTKLMAPIGLAVATITQADSPAKKSLYVANFLSDSILAYDWKEGEPFPSGDIAPSRVLSGTITGLREPIGLFADSGKDKLYITNYDTNSILVFNKVSDIMEVTTAPQRFVIVSNPSNFIPYDKPIGITVDTKQDILYVVYQGTNNIGIVDEISNALRLASGNINPTRFISADGTSKDRTKILDPRGVWIDPDKDRLYLAIQGVEDDKGADDAILVYDRASTVTGNIAPDWIIKAAQGGSVLFNRPYMLSMVSYTVNNDTKHRLFVANSGDGEILTFDDIDAALNITDCPEEALGTVPRICSPNPTLVVSGLRTQLNIPRGVFAEHQADGDTIYVANESAVSTYSIQVYEKVAMSQTAQTLLNQKPDRMISPSIHGPTAVTVNTESETLYVTNTLGNSISVFQDINNKSMTGNIKPARRIFGSSTRLNRPTGVALIPATGSESDKLYVANLATNNLLEFDLGQCDVSGDCDAQPTADSGTASSYLFSPFGVAVDPQRRLIFVANRDLKELNDRTGDSIVVFERSDSGLIPIRKISGDQTLIKGPAGLYLNTDMDLLYVANREDDTILVFDVSDLAFLNVCDTQSPANCNLAPIQIISQARGVSTSLQLDSPNWAFLDNFSNPNKLYVTSRDNDAILVYDEAETIDGEVVPARSIGSGAGLSVPVGIFLDPRK